MVLTLLPGNYIPKVSSFWSLFSPDKLVHLFLFSVFSFLIFHGFHKQYPGSRNRYVILKVLAVAAGLAIITEGLQAVLPIKRSGNIYDAIADIAGAMLGWGIFYYFKNKKRKKLPENRNNL